MRTCHACYTRDIYGRVLYEVEGRTAIVCQEGDKAVLKMFLNDRPVNRRAFALQFWDIAVEFGSGYLRTGREHLRNAS